MFKQVTRLNSGFSIVELMVVIAIFGILMAIGIPAYKDYIVKSRLTHVVKVLDSYLDKAKQGYINSGTIPATVMGVVSGSDTAVTNFQNIDFIYYNNGSGWANAGKAAMVQAVVSTEIGNSIEGYTAGTLGQYNRITLAFVIVDDQMQIYCGSWTSDTVDIPQEFLPSGCEDMGFAGTVMG